MKKLLLAVAVIASLASCSENKKTENPAPQSVVKRENGTVTIKGTILAKVAGDTVSLTASSSSAARAGYLDTLESANLPFSKFRTVSGSDITIMAHVKNVDLNLTNKDAFATENNGVTKVTGTVTGSEYTITVPVGANPTDVTLVLGDIDRTLSIPAKVTVGSSTENITIEIPTRHKDGGHTFTAVRGETYLINLDYDMISRSDRN